MKGYLRNDGRKGIRNIFLVVYLVECAHHVAREIVSLSGRNDVHLIGFGGCAPNAYASKILTELCTHPNVGGVLLVSLGCENIDRESLSHKISSSDRPVDCIVIQEEGGTSASISCGIEKLEHLYSEMSSRIIETEFTYNDLVIGCICGGSDATSGFTANPCVGLTYDRLIALGSTCIFEEPGELLGCEYELARRAISDSVGKKLIEVIHKADAYYKEMGHDSFSAGNAVGGLTTIEEKSLGSYCKSGSSIIKGIIIPGERPSGSGLYLMDVVPDGKVKWGFPNPNDNSEITEMIASGAHLILFTTGRGSVVGSVISPVIKICANPVTYSRMPDDMDINAGKIITDGINIDSVSDELLSKINAICCGEKTKSENLGHSEFHICYKFFQSYTK